MENNKSSGQFLMSINDAADRFGIGRQKLRHLANTEKDIPIIKIGQIQKIIVPELEKWLIQASESGREL